MEKLILKVQSSIFFKYVAFCNLCKTPVASVLQWWNLIKSQDTSTSNSCHQKVAFFFHFVFTFLKHALIPSSFGSLNADHI